MTVLSLLFPLVLAAQPAIPPADALPSEQSAEAPAEGVTVEELRRFALVFREVQNSYVEKVSERELMEAAIRGLLTGLDPHSTYLDHAELDELSEDASGEYGGLGLEVQIRDGMLKVVAAIDDTPAAAAGLKAGDVLLRINGTPIEGEAMENAVEQLRGEPGSEVTLTVLRDRAEPFELSLKREVIKVSSVRTQQLTSQIGYVRISTFQADTAAALNKAVRKLRDAGQMRGLVLDLRSNPGGLVQAAVGVVDAFLDSGAIVSTRGRQAAAQMAFTASEGDVLEGAPMLVLIDGGSASAAEIVAGALQDSKRALIVGQRSFGKGSVQSVLPLANGDGVKLTTARYYTPAGRSIQAQGIVPDVELPDVEFKRTGRTIRRTSEADLPGHLDGSTESAAKTEASDDLQGPGDDYALTEATHILAALIAQERKP